MSARPQRPRKPPTRFNNNQARNMEEAAARAAARPKRKRANEPNTSTQKRRATPSNINTNPKSKLLNTLAKLRNKEAPRNGLNRYGYTFLASLYRNHPAEQLKKYAFNWSNDRQVEFMKKQHRTLVKNTSRINAPNETVNIPMDDEKMHDLLVMLWMDMSHDKLFNGSFNTFLTSSIKNEITTKEIRPKTSGLVNKLIQFKILKISNGAIVLMSDIERKQKKFMHEIWGDPSYPPKIVKKTAAILSVVKNRSKPIYVSYDAENADYITELLAKSRMNDGTYYLKRIFTVANLMDPGRGASTNVGGYGRSGGSVNKLINRLFDEQNTSTPFKFNYQMFKFNFGNYFTIEIVPDGSKFNAKLNGKMLNMQVKKSEAQSGNALDRISKTFGDFIQIITVAHLRKSGLNVVSSTQDGGFVGMTGYIHSSLFGIEPALISDSTTVIGTGNRSETGIKFYGLQNYLRYNVEPERSGVTTRVNNNNNNNNNVSQPNANRVNTNRNKLIQNLKNKNLSNAAINDYVKSYNNGTKSVNQIIQEVRANAKRKQNAKNAATLRTLRQLRPELFN
jgi:hypothetical protein